MTDRKVIEYNTISNKIWACLGKRHTGEDTIKFLAQEIGCARQTLNDKMNGRKHFTADDINKICKVLGVSAGYLLFKDARDAEKLGFYELADKSVVGKRIRDIVKCRKISLRKLNGNYSDFSGEIVGNTQRIELTASGICRKLNRGLKFIEYNTIIHAIGNDYFLFSGEQMVSELQPYSIFFKKCVSPK